MPLPAGPPREFELREAEVVGREISTLGLEVTAAAVQALALYLRRIRQWNERINLVSAADVERLGRRHLLESFNVRACSIPLENQRLADVGSGAGFPGLPLAVLLPDLEVLLIESVRKKARFLEAITAELGLGPRVRVAAERAEVLGAMPQHRGAYSVVTLRGFGPLSKAVRDCGALVAPDGLLVAFKGSAPEDEIRDALPAFRDQRFVLVDIVPMRWGEGRMVIIKRRG